MYLDVIGFLTWLIYLFYLYYPSIGMVEVCGSWNKLAPTFEGSPSFTGNVQRQLEDAMGELDVQNVTFASSRVKTGFSPP